MEGALRIRELILRQGLKVTTDLISTGLERKEDFR